MLLRIVRAWLYRRWHLPLTRHHAPWHGLPRPGVLPWHGMNPCRQGLLLLCGKLGLGTAGRLRGASNVKGRGTNIAVGWIWT